MVKAAFFDRDGTINNDEGHYYIWKEDDFKWNNDVIESFVLLKSAGYKIIVISNQGGVGKGEYNTSDVDNIHNLMNSKLSEIGIIIEEFYYCPHHDSTSKCLCRKPKNLMIEKAVARYNIDKTLSFMIGDSNRDVEAAEKSGIKAYKIEKNTSFKDIILDIINQNGN